MLGMNPGLDLDEPELTAIAESTGGTYFRARDANELAHIGEVLDQLEPVAQQSSQARPAQPLFPWPLGTALLLSTLLVARDLWPHGCQMIQNKARMLRRPS